MVMDSNRLGVGSGSPLLFDRDTNTDDEFVADTPSPVFSLGKRKKQNSGLVFRPKKTKTETENVPLFENGADDFNLQSRPSRTKKSVESLKFGSALESLKRQRSKKAKGDIDTECEERPNFRLLSDTESDSDSNSLKGDSTKSDERNRTNPCTSSAFLSSNQKATSFGKSNQSEKNDALPNIASPTSLRTSRVSFACKKYDPKIKTKIPESPHEPNKVKRDRNSKGSKTSRRKRSVASASSFVYSDSDSTSSDTENESRNKRDRVGKQLKRAEITKPSRHKKITTFDSSSDSSDTEISDSNFSLSRGNRKTESRKSNETQKQKRKGRSDEFLPLTSDLSSSDIDEADFSSFLSHLVGNDSSDRKSNPVRRSRCTTAAVETTSDSDDDIAILDYIVSGKKEKLKVKAKDIKFPETSSKTKSRQGSLGDFIFGKGKPSKGTSTSASATVTHASTSSQRSNKSTANNNATPNKLASPSLQNSSVTDDLLVQALDTAENVASRSNSASPVRDNVGSQKSSRIFRRPGLPRSSTRSSGKAQATPVSTTGPDPAGKIVEASVDAVKTVEQLKSDEALARQLQEELDREVAASLGDTHSHSQFVPASSIINQPIQPSSTQAKEISPVRTEMLETIGSMEEYVWQLHVAVYKGENIPAAPPEYRNRDVNELLNFEVLAYLDETRKSNPNNDTQKVRQEAVKSKGSRPCPYVQLPVSIPAVGPSRRQNNTRNRGNTSSSVGTSRQVYDNATMLARIGSMSEEEWAFHRAVFRGTPPRRTGRGRNCFTLDTEVLQYLADRETHGQELEMRDQLYTSDSEDDSIADILEQLQAETYGLIGRPRRAAAAAGRRGRGRGGARGVRDLGRLLSQEQETGDDYEHLLELAEQLGSVKSTKGLSSGQINMLPTKSFRANSVKEGEAVPECHVCMCEYEENDQMRILTCFHSFHSECIDKWIKTNPSCPVCRSEIKLS